MTKDEALLWFNEHLSLLQSNLKRTDPELHDMAWELFRLSMIATIKRIDDRPVKSHKNNHIDI